MAWLVRGLGACRTAVVRHRDRALLAAAALALVASFFHPVATVDRRLFDQVIVLDITQSMNVADYPLDGKPVSRLVYAKHALRQAHESEVELDPDCDVDDRAATHARLAQVYTALGDSAAARRHTDLAETAWLEFGVQQRQWATALDEGLAGL